MDYQIILPGYKLSDKATLDAANAAFSICQETLVYARRHSIDLTIRCTDAQLGNFIASRALNGCRSNGILELNIVALGERPKPAAPKFNPNLDVRYGLL